MTETAALADLVLPATTFLEHDDIYGAGGHSHIQAGPAILEPPGECRSNHALLGALAARLGADHAGFRLSARDLADATLARSGWGGLERLEAEGWIDAQPGERILEIGCGWGGFAEAAARRGMRVTAVTISKERSLSRLVAARR